MRERAARLRGAAGFGDNRRVAAAFHGRNRFTGLNDSFHTYTWDNEGNPVTVDGNSLTYDALDRRVEYYSSSLGYVQYLWAPYDATRNLVIVAPAGPQYELPLPGGSQAILGSSGITEYRRANWQGSQVIDSTTSQTATIDASFSPYGEHYAENGDLGFFGGNLSIYPFFMDGYAATWRLYHYDQNRWISPDPAGLSAVDPTDPQTWNRYAYARGNPLGAVDPSGMDANNGTICYTTNSVGQQGIIFTITLNCYSYAPSSAPPNTVGGQVIYAQAGFTGQGSAAAGNYGTNNWRKISNCAADFGNKYSIASGISAVTGISAANPILSTVFGNDASSISDIVSGRNPLGATISEIFSNPGSTNVLSLAVRGVGAIPSGGSPTANIGVNGAGSSFVKAWNTPNVAGTALGRTAGAVLGVFTKYKAIYDFSVYGVGLASCW